MNKLTLILALALPLLASCSQSPTVAATKSEAPAEMTLHTFKVESLDAGPVDLAKYKGDVVLVVNVASECGYTPQYQGLETLEKELSPKGFHVLGFPSNEFGGQEPGAAAEIRKFCTEKYNVTFPMFSKSVTKAGPEQSPVFKYLGGATGQLPAWNFGKYLVGRDGKAVAYYPSKVKPDDAAMRAEIEKALAVARAK
ncbi:MAG TPA: glutathione peroxidase [Planctomycetota bacterium]|nr:glutathione peroxidase [Planctomycetota bacterium]